MTFDIASPCRFCVSQMDAESILVSTVDYDKDELVITWDPFVISAGEDAQDLISDNEC